jgi:hypothetical protein
MIVMGRWPLGCHNSRGRESASVYRRYGRCATGSSGRRCHVAGDTPATQQLSSIRGVTVSGGAVVSRCRPARCCHHQHATPREVASAIRAIFLHPLDGVRAICGSCTIHCARSSSGAKCPLADAASHTNDELHDGRPQG